jgi:predicted Zn-dependent protease
MKFNLNAKTIKFSTAIVIISFIFFSCDHVTSAVRKFIVSDEQEIQIGKNLKAQILADTKNYPQYNGNQTVINFVNTMGQQIASVQKDRPGFPFTFTIIRNDTEINAFSIPGGNVFVYTGLLKAVDNSAELAGVLAHEIGHITKYHCIDKVLEGQSVDYINSLIFGSDSSSLAVIANLATQVAFLKYSREDEFQADSCAVAYSTKATYNPVAIANFFTDLKNRYKDTPAILVPFSSHPPFSDRIEYVNKVIAKTPGVPGDTSAMLYQSEYGNVKV